MRGVKGRGDVKGSEKPRGATVISDTSKLQHLKAREAANVLA